MHTILPVAVTPRTVALCLRQPGALHHLDQPLGWQLDGAGESRSGTTGKVVTLWHDLVPGTRYRLQVDGFAPFDFDTLPCAGVSILNDAGQAQALIDALPPGGTLIVPAGRWQVAPLLLRSDMHLYLSEGAELAAPDNRGDFPILRAEEGGTWEGLPADCYRAILTAKESHNLTITGPGLVDGGGSRGDWWDWPKETRNGARRARLLHLMHCDGVTVAGPQFRNSPSWSLHPCNSRSLIFAGISIVNPPDSPNTDGLNPESCTDVTISGVHFTVGDDCIAIKAGKRDGTRTAHLAPTSRIAIRHCLMERGHGGVVLGSEMSGGISDVTVSDCEMTGTDRGLRIKTRRGRGGSVSGITMERVRLRDVDTVLAINAHYFCDADGHDEAVQSRAPFPVDDTTPRIRDITLRDITATGVRLAFAAVLGLPEAPVTGLRISGVTLSHDPDALPGVPLMADHLRPVRGAGLLSEHCEITEAPGLARGTLTDKEHLPCCQPT